MWTAKDDEQKKRCDKMKKRGHVACIAINILIWLFSYVFVWAIHNLCFKFGWLHSPDPSSFADNIFIPVIAGCIGGEFEWSNMKRKFAGESAEKDNTMI